MQSVCILSTANPIFTFIELNVVLTVNQQYIPVTIT